MKVHLHEFDQRCLGFFRIFGDVLFNFKEHSQLVEKHI